MLPVPTTHTLTTMKSVVIIGGGFAGAYAAKHLENDFNVTLIDGKDYFEFTPSVLRTIVEPTHIKKIQVLHTHYFQQANAKLLQRSLIAQSIL